MTDIVIPPNLADQRITVWRHHKTRELQCGVASISFSLLALGAAYAEALALAGPLAFCALILGLFAKHHNDARRDALPGGPMSDPCRCGHTGDGPHPCHYAADGVRPYTCTNPATQRFYGPHLTSLAGVQMKVGVYLTWACDEHWALFNAARVEANTP